MSARGNPAAPWFPNSPQLGTERIRHGTWKRTGPFDLGDMENDSLRRLDRQARRELEDIADGLEPDRPGRREHLEAELAALDLELTLRLLMQERYGARPGGTDHPDEYFNGRPAPAPSYWLALILDYRAFRRDEEPVIEWPDMEAKHGRIAMLDFLALDGEIVLEQAGVPA